MDGGRPTASFLGGGDNQLDYAIDNLMKKLAADPLPLPAPPPIPPR